jgi:hypothetical protein
MIVVITNEQKVKVTVQPTTEAGNPANIDGTPTFEVTEGDATVEPVEGEPNSAYLVSGAADVVSTIKVSADADLGEGVATIEEVITLNVVQASANTLGVVAGAAELK